MNHVSFPRVDEIALVGLAVLLLAVLAGTTPYGPWLGIAVLAFAAATLGAATRRAHPLLPWIVLGAFVVRLASAGVDEWLGLLPKADQLGYHRAASAIAAAWHGRGEQPTGLSINVHNYARLIGALYYVFGPLALLARAFSAFAGALGVCLVFAIAHRAFDRRAATVAALVYALLPSMAYVQSEILRDPTIHVLLLTCVWSALQLRPLQGGSVWRIPLALVLLVAAIGALLLLRQAAAIVILVPVILLLLWRKDRFGDLHVVVKLATLLVVIGALAYFGRNYAAMLQDLEGLTQYRSYWATGGSGYLEDRSFDSIPDLLLYVPLGALFFLFTPFPWQIHKAIALAAFIENLLFLWPLAVLATITAWRHRGRVVPLALVAYLVIGAALFGIIEGNVGTTLRHRTQFTWVIVVLAAPILVRLAERYAPRLAHLLEDASRPKA